MSIKHKGNYMKKITLPNQNSHMKLIRELYRKTKKLEQQQSGYDIESAPLP